MLESASMKPLLPPPVFTAAQVQAAVERIAFEIVAWLDGFPVPKLNLLCVLEGARPLSLDLSRNLKGLKPDLRIKEHFIRVRATDGHQLMETRQFSADDLDWDALGQGPVLIVDDLLDSGKTLQTIREKISQKSGAELKTAVLIRKHAQSSLSVDFCGLELNLRREQLTAKGLKDYWLYGYGMDLDGKHRELDYVAGVEVR
jgi:hypoxanthine phosphoribosyltransferase